MPMSSLRREYFDLVLKQVTSCRYSSPTTLDRIEEAIVDREGAEAYVKSLIDQAREPKYPSPMMLDRLTRLLDSLDGLG
jgi:hypothetical protein